MDLHRRSALVFAAMAAALAPPFAAAQRRSLPEGAAVPGWGALNRDVVLIGPANDPAGVSGMRDAAEALRRIASMGAAFISAAGAAARARSSSGCGARRGSIPWAAADGGTGRCRRARAPRSRPPPRRMPMFWPIAAPGSRCAIGGTSGSSSRATGGSRIRLALPSVTAQQSSTRLPMCLPSCTARCAAAHSASGSRAATTCRTSPASSQPWRVPIAVARCAASSS